MNKPMPKIAFAMMSAMFKVRDLLFPRREFLEEAGLAYGFRVLDYGCGPGAYTAGVSEMVGEAGKVYALDVHPLAIRSVQKIAEKQRLTNVETIHSDCDTGLPDGSLDVVLLYDIFHMLSEPQAILTRDSAVFWTGCPGGTATPQKALFWGLSGWKSTSGSNIGPVRGRLSFYIGKV